MSPGLQLSNLCIFMVGFMIDPSAQALGRSLEKSDFAVKQQFHARLERVNDIDNDTGDPRGY